MDLRKTFIKSDKFTNIANIEIESKRLRTLLMILLTLKVPLNANEELDYNTISFKLSANIQGKTPQLFARTLLDFIIDLNSSLSKLTNALTPILSENYNPPYSVSYKAGAIPETHTIKVPISFIPINPDDIYFNWGFPFTNSLNLEINAPAGKECEYEVYVLTREFLGDTPFITLHKKPQKVLNEISVDFENIQKLIYHTTASITGNENTDIYDLYTNEEKYTNIFRLLKAIQGAAGGSVPRQNYSEIIFAKPESLKLIMNLDTSLTDDRYFLYRKVSNAHRISIISPVISPPQYTIL